MSKVKAEYIWIDGTPGTPLLRSKTKVLPNLTESPVGLESFPVWGFDGSSTGQAKGHDSDCVLRPVRFVPDPISGSPNFLVLCEVYLPSGKPHVSNTRHLLAEVAAKTENLEPWFGIEQEYNMKRSGRYLGFPEGGFPRDQGPYYCGVGAADVFGRELAVTHLDACLNAGIEIAGINAEVMPGQWEFQVGPSNPLRVADELWLARWLLNRLGEEFGIEVTINPKPLAGNWNGAGAHTNFSTNAMRESYEAVEAAARALENRHSLHIENYGEDIKKRLTGEHETASWENFSFGVSNRGASVRIPWQVAQEGKGYIEDRRPNANCDPYTVTRLILETCCLGYLGYKE